MDEQSLLQQDISFLKVDNMEFLGNQVNRSQSEFNLIVKEDPKNIEILQYSVNQFPTIKSASMNMQVRQLEPIGPLSSQKNKKSHLVNKPSLTVEINQQQKENLKQNVFVGSNPGLFYTHQSVFDLESINQIKKLVSIQKISFKEVDSQIQQDENSLDSAKDYKYSQESGITIIDPSTEKQCEEISFRQLSKALQKQKTTQNLSIAHPKEGVFKKENLKPHLYIPQNRANSHTKHCDATIRPPNKQQQFVVPIITSKPGNNKSKYNSSEYVNLKDENLINFFTSRDKQFYVSNVVPSSNLLNGKCFRSQFFGASQKHSEKYSKSHQNKSQTDNHLRATIATNFRPKANFLKIEHFNSKNSRLDTQNDSDFGKVSIQNTKFLIKNLPSQKHKKFFNQSSSTLMNHNYRPLTCRKNKTKIEQQLLKKQMNLNSDQQPKSNNSNKFFLSVNSQIISPQKRKPILQKCDYWAQINSYKKMNQNSKKGNKVNPMQKKNSNILIKTENNDFVKQNSTKFLQIDDRVKEISQKSCYQSTKENNKFYSNPNLVQSSKLFSQSNTQFKFSSKQQSVSRYQNPAQLQMQIIRNNNIKRVKKFQKAVISKLCVVSKMGVKVTQT